MKTMAHMISRLLSGLPWEGSMGGGGSLGFSKGYEEHVETEASQANK